MQICVLLSILIEIQQFIVKLGLTLGNAHHQAQKPNPSSPPVTNFGLNKEITSTRKNSGVFKFKCIYYQENITQSYLNCNTS